MQKALFCLQPFGPLTYALCHRETHGSDTMLSAWQGMPAFEERSMSYFSGKCTQVETDTPTDTSKCDFTALARPGPIPPLFGSVSAQQAGYRAFILKSKIFSLAGCTAKAASAWSRRVAQQETAKLLRVSPSVPQIFKLYFHEPKWLIFINLYGRIKFLPILFQGNKNSRHDFNVLHVLDNKPIPM